MTKNSFLRKYLLFAEITVLLFSLPLHTIIPVCTALNHTSALLNPMVGSTYLMETCPYVFTVIQCWIFVSRGISHGIPKKVLSVTQPRMISCNLRLTTLLKNVCILTTLLKNVCIPFGSHIMLPIPCENSLVRGSSLGDRFVEGIYLHAALTGPVIHIFDIHRKQHRKSWWRISLPILQNFHSRIHLAWHRLQCGRNWEDAPGRPWSWSTYYYWTHLSCGYSLTVNTNDVELAIHSNTDSATRTRTPGDLYIVTGSGAWHTHGFTAWTWSWQISPEFWLPCYPSSVICCFSAPPRLGPDYRTYGCWL